MLNLKTDKMENVEQMTKIQFVDYLITGKGVSAFYYYYERILLSMNFDLDDMKLNFLIWFENKR
tara:strand:- start:459 stop:650 length:192 start_codon:yes stop_codon:yes gene_type:complete